MQLRKPVLLEGSPGVGKTSLVAALAKATGHSLVRINFSDQTDIMDLFGTDLPCVGADGEPMFKWSDGILLRALKNGSWVLLDDLNLAPQPVLEGLNALLDHREQVYIPELNQTFDCPSSFRVFAAPNPFHQGGGRKGLPKSFMNKFTAVTVAELLQTDLELIVSSIYPQIPFDDARIMVHYVQSLNSLANSTPFEGYPWEINLRDAFREVYQAALEPYRSSAFSVVFQICLVHKLAVLLPWRLSSARRRDFSTPKSQRFVFSARERGCACVKARCRWSWPANTSLSTRASAR
jgi:midasin